MFENPYMPDAHDWAHYVRLRVGAGWAPALLTFMFAQMPGGVSAIRRQQAREVEKIYARVVTRMVRRPASPCEAGRLPTWICFPDLPVPKRNKYGLRDLTINGGEHVHALTLTYPLNRLGTDFASFVEKNQSLLTNGLRCERVHAEALTHDVPGVLGYAAKSILSHRIEEESYFLLPKSLSEVREASRVKPDR